MALRTGVQLSTPCQDGPHNYPLTKAALVVAFLVVDCTHCIFPQEVSNYPLKYTICGQQASAHLSHQLMHILSYNRRVRSQQVCGRTSANLVCRSAAHVHVRSLHTYWYLEPVRLVWKSEHPQAVQVVRNLET